MATNTTNYGFKKPDESDFYDVNDQNNNWDLADEALKELDTPTFEDYTGDTEVPAAETALGNIKSKGKLATILSNIKAFCKGCCTLAMIVNNCVTDNPNMPLSAAQGKILMDSYTKLNSDLIKYTLKTDLNYKYPSDLSMSVFNLPQGNYFLRGTSGLPEEKDFYCEIIEYDSSYKTVKLFPSSLQCPYFYIAKCIYGTWEGFERYNAVQSDVM